MQRAKLISRRVGFVALALLATISLVACTAGADGSIPSAPASPIGRIRLQGLTVDQPTTWQPDGSNWSAELMWDAPATDIQHYTIRRDGITLADDLTEPSYTDDTISPAEHFVYEVVAVDPAATGATSNPPPAPSPSS